MNYDIFGGASPATTEYVLFHDESECSKSGYLYHGYLLIKKAEEERILNEMLEIKKEHYGLDKEIHFNKIRGRSDLPNGEKAMVARLWLKKIRSWMLNNQLKFYCMGVNRNNLKNFWNNRMSYDFNVYSRFFEIGLKSAVRWFAEGEIELIARELRVTHSYLDPKDECSDISREDKIKKLSLVLREGKKAGIIDRENIKLLDSDSRKSGLSISNFIQLVDVVCGVCRASFVEISKSKQGQQECVDEFIDIVERFNCKEKAYRKGALYYKKFAMQFFPVKSDLTYKEFISGTSNKGGFYCNRLTFRQEEKLAGQQTIFDLIGQ